MKRVICALTVIVFLSTAITIGSGGSDNAGAQDSTEDRLSALETTVAEQATQVMSVRKRIKALENAQKTAEARGEESVAESPTESPADDEGESAPPTETSVPAGAAGENTSPYISGNAFELLPPGDVGALKVALTGTYDGNNLPVLVRNNSDRDVRSVEVSATVRSADGKLIGSGGTLLGISPNLVRVGEYAFGYLYFDGIALPSDAVYEFEVSADDASDTQFLSVVDMEIEEAEFLGDRIVGSVKNGTSEPVSGPIGVSGICFDNDGGIIGTVNSYTDKDEVAAGESASFQIDLYGVSDCSNFLVAGSGYDF